MSGGNEQSIFRRREVGSSALREHILPACFSDIYSGNLTRYACTVGVTYLSTVQRYPVLKRHNYSQEPQVRPSLARLYSRHDSQHTAHVPVGGSVLLYMHLTCPRRRSSSNYWIDSFTHGARSTYPTDLGEGMMSATNRAVQSQVVV